MKAKKEGQSVHLLSLRMCLFASNPKPELFKPTQLSLRLWVSVWICMYIAQLQNLRHCLKSDPPHTKGVMILYFLLQLRNGSVWRNSVYVSRCDIWYASSCPVLYNKLWFLMILSLCLCLQLIKENVFHYISTGHTSQSSNLPTYVRSKIFKVSIPGSRFYL